MKKKTTAKENWEALEPLANDLKKGGKFYTPLHDYAKLRDTREEFYEYKLNERLSKIPDSSEEDIILFRLEHLDDELEIIKGWKSKEQNAPYSTELAKYRNYVIAEKGKVRNKAVPSFENLFFNPDNAKIVVDFLENSGYTLNGKWMFRDEGINEYVSLFHILMIGKFLKTKKGQVTTHQKVFFGRFGLEIGTGKDVSEGYARIVPNPSEASGDFESDLLPLLSNEVHH